MEISVWGCFPRFPVTLWNVCSFEFASMKRGHHSLPDRPAFLHWGMDAHRITSTELFLETKKNMAQIDSTRFLHFSYFCSIFKPFFIFPFPMEIVEALETGSSEGVGLLVDAKRGLILTDRHSAPQSLGATEAVRCGWVHVESMVEHWHSEALSNVSHFVSTWLQHVFCDAAVVVVYLRKCFSSPKPT